ncbi:substrate-binding periplasmic protein [Enterovibrio qingdaonensis]
MVTIGFKGIKLRDVLMSLALWIGVAVPTYALSYDDIQAKGVIRVAVYNDFPPYSFKDDDGNPAGMDIELAKALANGLNVDLELHWMTPDETVEDDMRNYLWKGMNLTSEDGQRVKADVMLRVPYDREFAMQRDDVGHPAHERVHMFAPYHQERWRMVFDAKKLDAPQTAARFMYHPVGVEVDTVPQFYLTTAYGGRLREKSHTYPSITDAFTALGQGEVAIVMGMSSQLEWLHQQNASSTDASESLTELAFPLLGRSNWELGMAVQTDYRQLAYALEDIVMAHIQNGDFARWGEKYGVDYRLPARFQPESEAIAQTP